MEFSISLPLDSDGFLRRECSNCGRQFKWHHGETEDRPADFVDPPLYYCPYCGEPSDDDWFTEEQQEYAAGMAAGPALDMAAEAIRKAFRGSAFSVSSSTSGGPDVPDPLVEPDDMMAVASPCHPWEPVKIVDEWADPVHCLVCGSQFQV